METEKETEREKGGGERWRAAIVNLSEMASNLDSLQRILTKKAVFVDDDTFAKASLSSGQARTIKTLEQRVETLERELDAAIAAAARARNEKRQAEAAQRAAELRAQDVTRELENTTKLSGSSPTPELIPKCLYADNDNGDQNNNNDVSTTVAHKVFTLHMEELRSKQEEISKKDHEIKVLEAIIQTLSRRDLSSADN